MHICELQHLLNEARNEITPTSRVKLHVAAVEDAAKLITEEPAWDNQTIAAVLGVPIGLVEAERPRTERHAEMKRKYLQSGRLETPDEMAHVSIFQR